MKDRVCVVGLAMVMSSLLCGTLTGGHGNGGQEENVTTVGGRVLNAVTREPISRALVVLPLKNAATFTDDRGQFEMKIADKNDTGNGAVRVASGQVLVDVRKPGFFPRRRLPTIRYAAGSRTEATIYLVPEAKIVGHVEVPGSEGDVRIRCQLYRRKMKGGNESWLPQGTFTTWADGEFRFSDLEAGTYRLITQEQVDPESTTPGAQLYAYPPLYYSNTTDFSLASPIVVKAGDTARVNLSVARREYYPVRIPMANMPAGRAPNLLVYPMGHRSPGWSLGYDPGESSIQGSLPDGNYTVEASVPGQGGMSGTVNFSVKGAPVEEPTLNLVPDATVRVRVREEFQSGQSNFVTAQTVSGNSQSDARRISNVHVNLTAIDQLDPFRGNATSELAEGSEGQELTIPDLGPGRYEVEVSAGIGYAASVQSGGKDLMHQPLVVGLGEGVAPIDVVLRDDGAEVEGTVEQAATAGEETAGLSTANMVYLVPTGETGGQPRSISAWQGRFTMQQVPPGNYLAVAFAEQPEDLAYGNDEATRLLLSKGGQGIHLEAGQKAKVKVRVIDSEGK